MKTSHYMRFREQAAKNRERIINLRAAGKTMQAIADSLGISRQRVNQILKKEAAK